MPRTPRPKFPISWHLECLLQRSESIKQRREKAVEELLQCGYEAGKIEHSLGLIEAARIMGRTHLTLKEAGRE